MGPGRLSDGEQSHGKSPAATTEIWPTSRCKEATMKFESSELLYRSRAISERILQSALPTPENRFPTTHLTSKQLKGCAFGISMPATLSIERRTNNTPSPHDRQNCTTVTLLVLQVKASGRAVLERDLDSNPRNVLVSKSQSTQRLKVLAQAFAATRSQ